MASSPSLISYGVICLLLVLLFTAWLVRYYARPGCPKIAMAFTGLAWLLTFSICFLVPIALYEEATDTLKRIWLVLFWMSFLLMWIILPFLSGYYDNGAFTFRSRIWASIKFNIVLYGTAAAIITGFIIYLAAAEEMNKDSISRLLMRLSNVWGLIMLILLLGYGLVEVPRHLYYITQHADRLRYLQYEAVSIHHERDDTLDELQATLKVIKDIKHKVEVTRNEQFIIWYHEVESVVHDREVEINASQRVGHPVDSDTIQNLANMTEVKEKTLITLHNHCKVLVRHLTLVETQWRDLVDEAADLQERMTYESSPPPRPNTFFARLRWSYRVHYRHHINRISIILLSIASLFIFVSEAILLSPVTPMSLILGKGIQTQNFIVIQLLSIGPMIYMSWCAYYALFRVRLFKLFHIGAHRTDENTLLLHGTILLRMSTPLAFNFTKMLKLPSDSVEFLIGPDTRLPFINGSDFSDIFPLFIVGIALITYFNLVPRLLSCLRINKYARGATEQSEEAQMNIDEGRDLIQRELRRRQTTTDATTSRSMHETRRQRGRIASSSTSHTPVASFRAPSHPYDRLQDVEIELEDGLSQNRSPTTDPLMR